MAKRSYEVCTYDEYVTAKGIDRRPVEKERRLCGLNGSGVYEHSRTREPMPELFSDNNSPLYPIGMVDFKEKISELPIRIREILWSYLCEPNSNIYYFKQFLRVNMIYQRREDNLTWHPDYPPDLRAPNDFSPFATIGEVMSTEFATIWRHRPRDWGYVCLGWGMFDEEGRFCPSGAMTKRRACKRYREDSDDKCHIRIFPFDDMGTMLCELPHNWNFQLYCWNDSLVPEDPDDNDYLGIPNSPWRYQCMTFGTDTYKFIDKHLVPERANFSDRYCPRWTIPEKLPTTISQDEITAGWEREDCARKDKDFSHGTVHEVINGGRTCDIPRPYPMFAKLKIPLFRGWGPVRPPYLLRKSPPLTEDAE